MALHSAPACVRQQPASKLSNHLHQASNTPSPASSPPAAAQAFPTYNSSTNASFTLHTTLADQLTAEAMCNREGAHLASFSSLKEQVRRRASRQLSCCACHATSAVPGTGTSQSWGPAKALRPALPQAEVEGYYMRRQELVANFHGSYWIGLQYDNTSGYWSWNDFSVYDPERGYAHWGVRLPDFMPEPTRNASCAVANASEAFDTPRAWGWADADCASNVLPFICRKAAPVSFAYVSNITGATYVLNTSLLSFAAASQTCNDNGGNLVYYSRCVRVDLAAPAPAKPAAAPEAHGTCPLTRPSPSPAPPRPAPQHRGAGGRGGLLCQD